MNGDEDLGQDIIMKGDKFHYQQNLGEMTITEYARGDEKKDEKKDDKKEEKKDEKKDEKKAEKKDEKKGDEKKDAEKKDDKKEDKKDGEKKDEKKDDKKDEKADEKKDEKKEDDEEEKKEEEKKSGPGEATWEEHNDCKENEWEAPDGNCAFEGEAVKIKNHNYLQVGGPQGIAKDDPEQFEVKNPIKYSVEGYPATEKVHTLSPEVHMEYSNQASTYLFPRTAFYVDVGEGEGLWMNADPPKQVESVRGPSNGAPLGQSVHDISIEGGEPYAAIHTEAEPARHLQHQPFMHDEEGRAAKDAAAKASNPTKNAGVTAANAPTAVTIPTGPLKETDEDKKKSLVQRRGPIDCNGSCPTGDQTVASAVKPEGMGALHGLVNDVNIYAYGNRAAEPERGASHQPVSYEPAQGAEQPKGKTFDQAAKATTGAGKDAAAAAPAAPAAPAEKAAL